ncbi:MAG: TIGR03618 family F420-dependent PPOX class oxidoreductase [Ktedonobacterales bacterium]
MAAITDAVREFLQAKRFAVLATISPDGTPHQTVMWYELRGDSIMMNTRVGRLKAAALRRDARASVCIADGYTFVTVSGAVTLDDNQRTAQSDIRALAIRYHGQEEGERQSREQFSAQQRVTINLPIQHLIAYGIG